MRRSTLVTYAPDTIADRPRHLSVRFDPVLLGTTCCWPSPAW